MIGFEIAKDDDGVPAKEILFLLNQRFHALELRIIREFLRGILKYFSGVFDAEPRWQFFEVVIHGQHPGD